MDGVEREILLSFWKVHILYHAAERPVSGQWVIRELRRHGYEVSPGTLYPLLARMEARGWLESTSVDAGLRARRDYRLTEKGSGILSLLRVHIEELYREVVLNDESERPGDGGNNASGGGKSRSDGGDRSAGDSAPRGT